MLSAVIIILREVLEAGLIISVLLASSRTVNRDRRWVAAGFALGILGAAITAYWLDVISDWADGAGQELLNTVLLLAIVLLLGCYIAGVRLASHGGKLRIPLFYTAAAAIACAIAREGAEIVIYAYGFATSFSAFMPVLIGGGIGAGIGASIAALLYYGLIYLPRTYALAFGNILILLIAAGMAAEAVIYLTQAGLLPAYEPLWDSSAWLPETSVFGQLLYALAGYEATPTITQVAAYLATLAALGAALGFARSRAGPID
jgi:high-affinity iron transporter